MGIEENFSIGVRKAKKLSAFTPTPFEESEKSSETSPKASITQIRDDLAKAPPVSAMIPAISTDNIQSELKSTPRSTEPSREEIIALAQKMGLKFEAQKPEFTKHTYSVTKDSKSLFKKYCDVLGYNMQDAMEESLQDFFKKHALEYARVSEAKRR